ncbi:hypothetical protein [Burkholderia glumae]|uniref:hypothetical protein n=1 Tax=Burkholderia glumae TaxID=337 RepID=UPI0003A1FAC3|nr:hypothetical protein [Burkholderia glumae]MCM2495365.1 hypothetical protein [Burkholderia glumae]MCM2546367.1 hypothetical protein [Burkholderia glumae]NVE24974.1 hypothetical protein [Burkholderia glumae]QJP70415.1 hypothetical protein HJC54_09115 [Burkholderia glumae]QJW80608.1 hypothetical protein GAS18_17770 [Burkholderia glumae]
MRDIERFIATLAARAHIERVIAGYVHGALPVRVDNRPQTLAPADAGARTG